MLLRFIGLFLPIKRAIWVQKDQKMVLRRLRKYTTDIDTDIYSVIWSWNPPNRRMIQAEYMLFGQHHVHNYIPWGEYRPWWNPLPPEEDSRLIEINRRAKKEIDGRLRKTRSLKEIYADG